MPHAPDHSQLDEPLPGLAEEALQWLVDLHDGEQSEARWDQYLAWCERSAEHQRAALLAEALWENLGSSLQRPHQRRRVAPLLGMLVLLGATALGWQARQDGWLADQRTGIGEHRVMTLADGSQLELAPQTRVDIDLKGPRRVVRLYSGELHVQVAPDPQHPFEVEAAGGQLRALGTAFDVRNEAGHVRLVVTEHKVAVALPEDSGEPSRQVNQGQALEFDARGVSAIETVDIDSATAWRRNRLVFDNQPLEQVLKALGRYQNTMIWITDPALRALPVTGTLRTDDPQAQLQWLTQVLPVRIRQWPMLTLVEPAARPHR